MAGRCSNEQSMKKSHKTDIQSVTKHCALPFAQYLPPKAHLALINSITECNFIFNNLPRTNYSELLKIAFDRI